MTITETPVGAEPPQAPVADTRPVWRRPPVFPILLIWAGLTVLLLLFAIFVPARVMGPPASSTMQEIESTVTSFSIASAPVAAMVWAILIYSIAVWRHRGREAPPETAPPIRGNQRLQVVWLVGSTVLALFLLIWGLVVIQPTQSLASATTAPLVVDVTGQQWTWTFEYPGGRQVSDELYLPVDQPVLFKVRSKDVIHSFWIVEMGVKVDANPGETTTAKVTPSRIGTFTVRCAELCGLYHSYMQTTVHVVSKDTFASWLQTAQTATS